MRRFDITKFVLLVLFFCFLVSCDRKKTVFKESVEQVKKNTENQDAVDDEVIHANLSYFDFDRIENLGQFFDSIADKHGIPIRDLGDEEHNERYVYDCIKRIENFRRGIVKFYPDDAVRECISLLGLECAFIANHACSIDIAYAEWFMMLAAYYSPDITYLVDMQSPDHSAGIRNFGNEYNYTPWWSYLFLKREKGYEVRSLGDDVKIEKLFQLEDEQGQRYYLCTNYTTRLEFMNFLYWRKDSINVINVTSCNNVNDIDVDFDSFYFNPQTLTWSYCREDTKSGKLIPVSEKPAMKLHLDGMNSKFITEF